MKSSTARILAFVIFFFTAYHASAYIPSPEQILQQTVAVNRHLSTIEGHLETTVFDNRFDDGKLEIDEHIYMKGLGSFRSEQDVPSGTSIVIQNGRKAVATADKSSNGHIRRIETVFPLIYFHNSVDTLIDDLNYLGVNTKIVAFDRINETTAFVIGTGETQTPGSKLWIDKKQGFPLRFIGIGTFEGKRIALRADYLDYTRIKGRYWFPTKIDYYINDKHQATSIFRKISINQPIADTLFEIPKDRNSYIPLAHFLTVKE